MDIKLERRRKERARTNLAVKFKLLPETGSSGHNSSSENISEGGMCIKASEFIPFAKRLLLMLDVPRVQKTIKAICKVAWIRKVKENEEYEVGLHFVEVGKKDKDLIADLVKPKE